MAVAKTTTKQNCKYTHTRSKRAKTRLVKSKKKSENCKVARTRWFSPPHPLSSEMCSECRKRKRNWSWKSCE